MFVVTLNRDILNECRRMASLAEIGGRSSVRGRNERMKLLQTDQLIGQIGQAAYSLYEFGSLDPWLESRKIANQNPYAGDVGEDFPGLMLDVKTSLMRYGTNPNRYRLAVRPQERHKDWVYVLALVFAEKHAGVSLNEKASVCLVGYAKDDDLICLNQTGVFSGAFTVMADELRSLAEPWCFASEIESYPNWRKKCQLTTV